MKETTAERSSHGPSDAAGWTEVDVAVYETFVVPRYTARFGELLVEMVTPSVDARIAHLGCRTGYPDPQVLARLPDAHLYGWDRSVPAVELARVKQRALGVPMEYATTEDGSNPFPEGAFSHVFSIHPTVPRKPLLHEFYRLLAPAGQALLALPLRGSFLEIADLLREYALRHDVHELPPALDRLALERPTPEVLAAELEAAGFGFVDVEVRPQNLVFRSARDLFEDPISRLFVLPEFAQFGDVALRYVREAIDKYFSESDFELSLFVACASGRR